MIIVPQANALSNISEYFIKVTNVREAARVAYNFPLHC